MPSMIFYYIYYISYQFDVYLHASIHQQCTLILGAGIGGQAPQ